MRVSPSHRPMSITNDCVVFRSTHPDKSGRSRRSFATRVPLAVAVKSGCRSFSAPHREVAGSTDRIGTGFRPRTASNTASETSYRIGRRFAASTIRNPLPEHDKLYRMRGARQTRVWDVRVVACELRADWTKRPRSRGGSLVTETPGAPWPPTEYPHTSPDDQALSPHSDLRAVRRAGRFMAAVTKGNA